ncbi:MAG: ATP-binding cassette domain-containing protein, partial [Acidimicrobiia bacterium]
MASELNGAAAPDDGGAPPAREPADATPVLDLRDVRTYFDTPRGTVRAVDGVTLTLERGQTLGIVGESGCGKTVLSRSIIGLLPRVGVTRSGQVLFDGLDLASCTDKELRTVLGARISMIFQDPMTSLHPVMKVGKQITDVLKLHLDMS